MSTVNGRMIISYEEQGVKRSVEHEMPGQPVAGANERNLLRNMRQVCSLSVISHILTLCFRSAGTSYLRLSHFSLTRYVAG